MRKAFKFGPVNIFHLLIIATFFSCNESGTNVPAEANSKIDGSSPVKSETSILLSQSVQHLHSDVTKQDTFRLTITGKTVSGGNARFDIIDFRGHLLYTETFPAVYFLGFADDQNETPIQKEKYIIKRAYSFFDEENFLKPAIKTNDLFDAEYSDKFNWVTIKSDPYAIGFNFLTGEENARIIAYSRKYKKVLVIFSCC